MTRVASGPRAEAGRQDRWRRRRTALLCAAGLLVVACSSAGIQPPPARQAAATSLRPASGAPGAGKLDSTALNSRLLSHVTPPTVDGDLPIGPGDLIEVSVFEVEELSKLRLRVPLRGTVTLPLLGRVQAAGRTAIELEEDIRTQLQKKYMHDPQVSVFVHEQKSQRISVIGAVRRGGVYPLSGGLRLADALAAAEGLSDDAGHRLYLIRRVASGATADPEAVAGSAPFADPPTDEVMAVVDLEALASGREDLNVPLKGGDVLHVPRAGSYYVGGSVQRPGSFLLKSKTTVEQAVLAAGGVRDVADQSDVRIYRTRPGGSQDVITFSLDDFERGQPAPELEKDDVIMVGKSFAKAFWFGFLDFAKGVFGMSKGL